MMNNEQILKLVKEHFEEWEADEDGYCWVEFAGKPDSFLKFALEIHEMGYNEGYEQCSFDIGDENV